MNWKIFTTLSLFCLLWMNANIYAQAPCCAADGHTAHADTEFEGLKIPNVPLVDQDGNPVKFKDLIKGKIVALNFIFTTCTTICPPMGANFSNLKKRMGDHPGKDLAIISISLDPLTDTPERLKSWRDKFGDGNNWTLLTGKKQNVDKLLKALKVFTPLKEEHAPVIIMGALEKGNWIRTNGLAKVEELEAQLYSYFGEEGPTKAHFSPEESGSGARPKVSQPDPQETATNIKKDRAYFTDTPLINHKGEVMRFFSDLLQDHIVVINPFFAECKGSCPAMHSNLRKMQQYYGEKMGEQIHFISLSVDAGSDSTERLGPYADAFGAGEGWYFLSGEPENVNTVLAKVGNSVTSREAHKTIFLVGNVRTRLWKKVDGLASAEEIIKVVNSVIEDQ